MFDVTDFVSSLFLDKHFFRILGFKKAKNTNYTHAIRTKNWNSVFYKFKRPKQVQMIDHQRFFLYHKASLKMIGFLSPTGVDEREV